MAPLDTAGWAHNGGGEIVNGQMRSPEGINAYFKHAQELQGGDVWRMRVEGGSACVGFATEKYNAEKHGETYLSIIRAWLYDGSMWIHPDISQDGQEHCHGSHLGPHIPEAPFDLAVRCEAVSAQRSSDSIQR